MLARTVGYPSARPITCDMLGCPSRVVVGALRGSLLCCCSGRALSNLHHASNACLGVLGGCGVGALADMHCVACLMLRVLSRLLHRPACEDGRGSQGKRTRRSEPKEDACTPAHKLPKDYPGLILTEPLSDRCTKWGSLPCELYMDMLARHNPEENTMDRMMDHPSVGKERHRADLAQAVCQIIDVDPEDNFASFMRSNPKLFLLYVDEQKNKATKRHVRGRAAEQGEARDDGIFASPRAEPQPQPRELGSLFRSVANSMTPKRHEPPVDRVAPPAAPASPAQPAATTTKTVYLVTFQRPNAADTVLHYEHEFATSWCCCWRWWRWWWWC